VDYIEVKKNQLGSPFHTSCMSRASEKITDKLKNIYNFQFYDAFLCCVSKIGNSGNMIFWNTRPGGNWFTK
jgi:hypothetical protein